MTSAPNKDLDGKGDENTGPSKDLPFATGQVQMSSNIVQNVASTQLPLHAPYFLGLPGKVEEKKPGERDKAQDLRYFYGARVKRLFWTNRSCVRKGVV